MAKFEARVVRVRIEPHPDADRMEIAHIDGYQCCVGKNTMCSGDLAVYIPDGAIVPESLLDELELTGKLAGAGHDRVRPIVLRGVLSQGLAVPLTVRALNGVTLAEGNDAAHWLGVTKYEPTPPPELLGAVLPAHGECLDFDVEDARRYPGVMKPNEPVVITEKIHGVMTCLAITGESTPLVTSKGLSHKGLKFDVEARGNATTLHVAMWHRHAHGVRALYEELGRNGDGVYLLGESAGGKLQDLNYGLSPNERVFRAFDIYIGDRRRGTWLARDAMAHECAKVGIGCVPEIARMGFEPEAIASLASGRSTVPGAPHGREGVVARLVDERCDPRIGRVILKWVSPKQLVRANATELS